MPVFHELGRFAEWSSPVVQPSPVVQALGLDFELIALESPHGIAVPIGANGVPVGSFSSVGPNSTPVVIPLHNLEHRIGQLDELEAVDTISKRPIQPWRIPTGLRIVLQLRIYGPGPTRRFVRVHQLFSERGQCRVFLIYPRA